MKKFFTLLPALALFLSCGSPKMITKAELEGYTEQYTVEDNQGEICILYYPSAFKISLMTSLASNLNDMSYSVTADNISNGSAYSPYDYNAVILLSEIQAFHPLPLAPSFIKQYDYAPNIIYFSSYSVLNKPYAFSLKRKKIDAITSASIQGDVVAFDAVRDEVLARVKKIVFSSGE